MQKCREIKKEREPRARTYCGLWIPWALKTESLISIRSRSFGCCSILTLSLSLSFDLFISQKHRTSMRRFAAERTRKLLFSSLGFSSSYSSSPSSNPISAAAAMASTTSPPVTYESINPKVRSWSGLGFKVWIFIVFCGVDFIDGSLCGLEVFFLWFGSSISVYDWFCGLIGWFFFFWFI